MKAAIDALLQRFSGEMRRRDRTRIDALRIAVSEDDVRHCLWEWQQHTVTVVWREPRVPRLLDLDATIPLPKVETRSLQGIRVESNDFDFGAVVLLVPSAHIEAGHLVAYSWSGDAYSDVAPVIVTYQWRCLVHPECRANVEMGKACLAAQRKEREP